MGNFMAQGGLGNEREADNVPPQKSEGRHGKARRQDVLNDREPFVRVRDKEVVIHFEIFLRVFNIIGGKGDVLGKEVSINTYAVNGVPDLAVVACDKIYPGQRMRKNKRVLLARRDTFCDYFISLGYGDEISRHKRVELIICKTVDRRVPFLGKRDAPRAYHPGRGHACILKIISISSLSLECSFVFYFERSFTSAQAIRTNMGYARSYALRMDLAQFRELAAFAQFGSDLDAKTLAQIDRGKRIMEIFKQPQYNPIPVEVQVAVIWAMQNGYVDQVPVERIKEFQTKFTEFLTTRKVELLAKIEREKAVSDALKAELKTVTDEFKQTWK